MKRSGLLAAALACVLIGFPTDAPSQSNDAPALYVVLECMKSSTPEYVYIETELWKPVHQSLVDSGKRDSWALYEVEYGDRTVCDYYTVTTYRGEEQLNTDPAYGALFAEVHPNVDVADAMLRTGAARERLSTELWRMIDSTDVGAHRYAVMNRMYADDPLTYEQTESRVFKAAHQVLIDEGHRTGWGVYELVSPIGSEIPYNYATVDLTNELGPVPMAQAMMTANPDRDLDEMYELLEVRDQVRSETWRLVAATTAPTAE